MIFKHNKLKTVIAYNKPISNKNNPDYISESAVIEEAKAVYYSLSDQDYNVEYLPVENIPESIKKITRIKPDVIFNLCEGFRGKSFYESHIASLWELMSIPYTGNQPLTLGISLNKAMTKNIFNSKKIPTPLYQIYNKVPEKTYLDFPIIAKPVCEDASLGITQKSVIYSFDKMCQMIKSLLEKFKQPVLVEKYIEGREFNVSILGNNPPRVLAISEVDFSQLTKEYFPIVSYEAKWLKDHPLFLKTPVICPAQISIELENKITDTALKVYSLLGGRDYGRVDIRVNKTGALYVLEFNPNPDISPDAGYAKALEQASISYNQFVDTILHEALKRKNHD